ncbi:MAG: nickel/cobalt transporter [Alphaproteobacteria bacterium]
MNRGSLVVLALLIAAAIVGAHDASANLLGNRSGAEQSDWSWLPGPLRDLMAWVVAQQAHFSRELREAVSAYRDDEAIGPAVALISISFLYGVFHAVGPGHGKAVVTGYFLARESEIKGGLLLGWLIAGIQAAVAIGLVGLLGWALDFSRIALLDSMPMVELGSYALVVLLGAGMTYAVLMGHECGHDHGHHLHDHDHGHNHDEHCDHTHSHDDGHSHIPGPRRLRNWEFLSAAFASGIRPCTGALIVLLFALANDVFLIGALSAIAMGIGVAITVSCVGIAAILARRGLMRLSLSGGSGAMLAWVPRGLALMGSLAVCLIGVVLFLSAFSRIGQAGGL